MTGTKMLEEAEQNINRSKVCDKENNDTEMSVNEGKSILDILIDKVHTCTVIKARLLRKHDSFKISSRFVHDRAAISAQIAAIDKTNSENRQAENVAYMIGQAEKFELRIVNIKLEITGLEKEVDKLQRELDLNNVHKNNGN